MMRDDIATAIRANKYELDPARFYEPVSPRRQKELAASVAALRAEKQMRWGSSGQYADIDL